MHEEVNEGIVDMDRRNVACYLPHSLATSI